VLMPLPGQNFASFFAKVALSNYALDL